MKNSNDLHKEFVRLGKERNKITYKLLALLPKIAKHEIYKKYNYSSIYEYAGKLAGIPHSAVDKTLQLHKNLRGKPCLQKAVKSQGIHKVALVARLATSETDRAFADKVNNMSKVSLGDLAKEMRIKDKVDQENTTLLCHAALSAIKIELDDEMQFLFLKLKKKCGDHLSNKEVLRKILREAQQEQGNDPTKLLRKKGKSQSSLSEKFSRGEIKKESQQSVKRQKVAPFKETKAQKAPTRYIPAHQKRAALQRSADKCAYPGCLKPADHFHHTKRFSEARDHKSITPLCKTHHEFAHNGLIGNEEKSVGQWKLNVEVGVNSYADAHFRACRRKQIRQKT
jgi:hypothetical protein